MNRVLVKLIVLISVFLHPTMGFGEDVRIGVVLGLTGAAGVWSEYARNGLELAVSEVNAGGGAAGKTLKLIFEDSRSSASGATSAFQKLVNQDKVSLIVGDVWAFLTVPLIPLSERQQIVLISPTVMDRSIPYPSSFYFSLGHRFESLRDPIRKFLALNPGMKKAGTISFDDYWNEAFVSAFSEAAAENGVSVIKNIRLNDFSPDFRTEVAALKGAGADILLGTWRPEAALQRMKEQNYHVPFLCSSDAVEAVLFRSKDRSLFEGMYFVDWQPSLEFTDKFKARFNKVPLYEAQNSYEIIRSVAKALEQKAPDFRTALSRVVYDGVEGKIDFRNTQFPNMGKASLFRVQGGVFAAK